NVTLIYSMTSWMDEDIADYVKSGTVVSFKTVIEQNPRRKKDSKFPEYTILSRPIAREADRIIVFGGITTQQAHEVDAILNELERNYPVSVRSWSHTEAYSPHYSLNSDFPRYPAPLDFVGPPERWSLAGIQLQIEAAEREDAT